MMLMKKIVEFTGDIEKLLQSVEEKDTLLPYFIEVNRFELCVNDNGLCEIFVKINDVLHYFYVSENDIKVHESKE